VLKEKIMATQVQPWASGPGEILRHGLELLRKDTDTNRRLAMISIDNAVELMVKTYLGLPKRITGLSITRKDLQEIGESFPAMLDALERHASDRLDGIDLGTIEWYHRLRNELYHQGNGLTVERDKIEIYAELANALFKNLFGQPLVEDPSRKTEVLGEFLAAWTEIERSLQSIFEREVERTGKLRPIRSTIADGLKVLAENRLLDAHDIHQIQELRLVRNLAAHGERGWEEKLTPNLVQKARRWATRLRDLSEHIRD
jgi:hypothetical protein